MMSFSMENILSFTWSHSLIVDLSACDNGAPLKSIFLWQWVQGFPYFRVYQIHCSLFYIKVFDTFGISWGLFKVTRMNLFGFYYMELWILNTFVWTPFVGLLSFFLSISIVSLSKSGISRCANLNMDLEFNSIYQCIWFCANIILLLLL